MEELHILLGKVLDWLIDIYSYERQQSNPCPYWKMFLFSAQDNMVISMTNNQ